jgi:hypothetical protein
MSVWPIAGSHDGWAFASLQWRGRLAGGGSPSWRHDSTLTGSWGLGCGFHKNGDLQSGSWAMDTRNCVSYSTKVPLGPCCGSQRRRATPHAWGGLRAMITPARRAGNVLRRPQAPRDPRREARASQVPEESEGSRPSQRWVHWDTKHEERAGGGEGDRPKPVVTLLRRKWHFSCGKSRSETGPWKHRETGAVAGFRVCAAILAGRCFFAPQVRVIERVPSPDNPWQRRR